MMSSEEGLMGVPEIVSIVGQGCWQPMGAD